jgi:hypothetical protein
MRKVNGWTATAMWHLELVVVVVVVEVRLTKERLG